MNRYVVSRIALFCGFLLILVSFHLGCKPTSENATAPKSAATQNENPLAVKVINEEVGKATQSTARIIASKTLPDKPLRIVSMAPNVTEILFALGMGGKLVGVTRYCDYPAQALDVPKIGGMLDPDFEAIVAARPDLVLGVLGGADSRIGDRLEVAQIPYFFVQMDTIEQTYEGIAHFGRVAGDAAAGQAAADMLKNQLAELSATLIAGRAGNEPKSVLMVFDHEPVIAAGPKTFSYELIEMAGFKNATAGFDNPYPVMDMEKVIEVNPDILIDAKIPENKTLYGDFWSKYSTLKAVKSGAVKEFSDPALLRPGPRLAEALEIIGSVDDQVVIKP